MICSFHRLKAMFMGFSSEVNVKWFFFATEHTQIDFKKLKKVLERYDPTKVRLTCTKCILRCEQMSIGATVS